MGKGRFVFREWGSSENCEVSFAYTYGYRFLSYYTRFGYSDGSEVMSPKPLYNVDSRFGRSSAYRHSVLCPGAFCEIFKFCWYGCSFHLDFIKVFCRSVKSAEVFAMNMDHIVPNNIQRLENIVEVYESCEDVVYPWSEDVLITEPTPEIVNEFRAVNGLPRTEKREGLYACFYPNGACY